MKICLEQLVGPNTPEHMKRSAADVLACVCLGRHPQCSLALMGSDINDLVGQALKIASCNDAHVVKRSTQLCVLLLLCSLYQEQEMREAVRAATSVLVGVMLLESGCAGACKPQMQPPAEAQPCTDLPPMPVFPPSPGVWPRGALSCGGQLVFAPCVLPPPSHSR